PGMTGSRARIGRPSAVSSPSAMSFWTSARDNPDASAMNRSARLPAAPGGTSTVTTRGTSGTPAAGAGPAGRREPAQPLAEQPMDQQQHDGDADGRVRDVP